MSWAQGKTTSLHPLTDLFWLWASEGSFPGATSHGEDLPSCIASPPENIFSLFSLQYGSELFLKGLVRAPANAKGKRKTQEILQGVSHWRMESLKALFYSRCLRPWCFCIGSTWRAAGFWDVSCRWPARLESRMWALKPNLGFSDVCSINDRGIRIGAWMVAETWLGCLKSRLASRLMGGSSSSALVTPAHLECCVQSWAPSTRRMGTCCSGPRGGQRVV